MNGQRGDPIKTNKKNSRQSSYSLPLLSLPITPFLSSSPSSIVYLHYFTASISITRPPRPIALQIRIFTISLLHSSFLSSTPPLSSPFTQINCFSLSITHSTPHYQRSCTYKSRGLTEGTPSTRRYPTFNWRQKKMAGRKKNQNKKKKKIYPLPQFLYSSHVSLDSK